MGIFLLMGGGISIYIRSEWQDRLQKIQSTQISSTRDLKVFCQSAKNKTGTAGGFKHFAKVNGLAKCDNPLTGELSGQACVYYEMQVLERYEGTFEEKDSEGNTQHVKRIARDTLANNSQAINFDVEDLTGRITVNPGGAKVDPIEVMNKFENYVGSRNSISIGRFSMDIGRSRSDHRILGYEFTEKIIPPEHRVLVVGEVTDRSGELMIQRPLESGTPFIITLKSEEELINELESEIKIMLITAIGTLSTGLLLSIWIIYTIRIAGIVMAAALMIIALGMLPLIAGIVLTLLSPAFIYMRRKSQDKLLEIKSTQISPVKDLQELFQSVKEGLGTTGGFKQLTEVKGVVKCVEPLKSPLSQKPCVYYEMSVVQNFKELGSPKSARPIASDSQAIPFEVDDATGRITVNPKGALIEPVQVLSKQEQNIPGRNSISYGEFTLNFNVSQEVAAGGGKIVGYELTEKIIPLERPVYVIGEATDASGSLAIQRSSEKGKPFIITVKTEEDLKKDTEARINILKIGAMVSLIAGLGAIVYAIFGK